MIAVPRVHVAEPRVHVAEPRVHVAEPRVHVSDVSDNRSRSNRTINVIYDKRS
jgi:hypothetical protein